jgi:hypothetical protein
VIAKKKPATAAEISSVANAYDRDPNPPNTT